jgi:hypothetical protein
MQSSVQTFSTNPLSSSRKIHLSCPLKYNLRKEMRSSKSIRSVIKYNERVQTVHFFTILQLKSHGVRPNINPVYYIMSICVMLKRSTKKAIMKQETVHINVPTYSFTNPTIVYTFSYSDLLVSKQDKTKHCISEWFTLRCFPYLDYIASNVGMSLNDKLKRILNEAIVA